MDETRRRFLRGSLLAGGGALLSGCDAISQSPAGSSVLGLAEPLSRRVQQFLSPARALAPEYGPGEISPVFRPNGTTLPETAEYQALLARQFADYRLLVNGLVQRPGGFTLAQLKQLGSRTQITRHDCVEGWSVIGKWRGVPLGKLLDQVGMRPQARYVVLHCFDEMQPGEAYYESMDLVDAYHPQTLLAYELNDQPLPIANGAPLRLRLERQLGYKQAKYIKRIELVSSFAGIAGGKGGFWEDNGYEWYAGI